MGRLGAKMRLITWMKNRNGTDCTKTGAGGEARVERTVKGMDGDAKTRPHSLGKKYGATQPDHHEVVKRVRDTQTRDQNSAFATRLPGGMLTLPRNKWRPISGASWRSVSCGRRGAAK